MWEKQLHPYILKSWLNNAPQFKTVRPMKSRIPEQKIHWTVHMQLLLNNNKVMIASQCLFRLLITKVVSGYPILLTLLA